MMFGWFAPRCPVDTFAKTWLETRMQWLAEQFSAERLLAAEVILSTKEFFPDAYAGEVDDARAILGMLARWMKADENELELEVLPDHEIPGAAGHYELGERKTIRIAESTLSDPLRLTATLAHELSHELLLGHREAERGTADEATTDLLPVFLGLGVFNANATVHESNGREGNVSWWTVGRAGYLTSLQYGYALALFAYARGELKPSWAEYLRLDARSPFQQGVRYLQKTGDTLFDSDSLRRPPAKPTAAECVEALRHPFASRRMRSLWEIGERQFTEPEVAKETLGRLADADQMIVCAAARTLGDLSSARESVGPILLEMLPQAKEDLRAEILVALGKQRFGASKVLPELTRDLDHDSSALRFAARTGLIHFGAEASSAVARLAAVLASELVRFRNFDAVADALVAVTDDPWSAMKTVKNLDPEIAGLADEAIEHALARRETTSPTPRTTS